MRIKKLLLPLLVMALVFVNAISASAATLAISASKTSGQVGICEKISYVATTDSKTVGIKSVTIAITDTDTSKSISKDTKNTTGSLVGKYTYTYEMPNTPHKNISVKVTVKDNAGESKSATYKYTMSTKNTFKITASPASGKISAGQQITLVETASLQGAGIKTTTYKFYDSLGKEIKTKTTTPDDNGKGVGVAKFTWNILAPTEETETLKLKVSVTDILGNKASQEFNYTMDIPKTTVSHEVKNQLTNAVIPNNSSVGQNQAAYINAVSAKSTIGIRTFAIKITNQDNGSVYLDKSETSTAAAGASPLKYKFSFPSVAGKYRIDVTSTDIKGQKHSATFYFTVTANIPVDDKNTITLSTDYPSGSVLAVNSKVKFTSTSSNQSVGTKTLKLVVYKNDEKYDEKSATSSYATTVGSNPMSYNYTFNRAGAYRVEVTSTDVKGNVKTGTYMYTITDGTGTKTEVSISFDPASNSTVEKGDQVRATVISSIATDPVKTVSYVLKDANGKELNKDTQSTSKQTVYYDITIPNGVTTSSVTLQVTGLTQSGATKTAQATYKIKDQGSNEEEDPEDDPEDDEDEEPYGNEVINPDGEDLAIDLFTKDNERMYELNDTIDFVAYYYNFEKSSKKNVVIEVEIPEGFKVMSKSTSYGSVKVKNDTIVYTIGTVPSKTLRKVNFSLKANDDDLSETANNIEAIIYSDTDDEEDRSTQRIYIYESGEKGSRKAFVTGYTDGTFRPDNNITREEVAAMMARAFNYAANSYGKSFSDVKSTSWSYKYVLGCYNKNVIKGYTDGTFRPRNNISVKELYTMTYRSMGISEDEKALFVPKKYKKETQWETNYIAGLARLGMLNDDHMEDLEVDDYATRAEVVYLISRVQFRNTSSFSVGYYFDVDGSYWNGKDIEAASYNYTYQRTSSGKEKVTTGGTFLETNSNYIK